MTRLTWRGVGAGLLVCSLSLLSGLGAAQNAVPVGVPAQAAAVSPASDVQMWLNRALEVQGLQDPQRTSLLFFTLEARFLDSDEGLPEIDRLLYDIPGGRSATFDNVGLPSEAQVVVTPGQALYSSKNTGVLWLPRNELSSWHSPLDLGAAGLLVSRTPGVKVTLLGRQSWQLTPEKKVDGTALRLRLHSHDFYYLLDDAAQVLAYRSADDNTPVDTPPLPDDEEFMTIVPGAWQDVPGGGRWMKTGVVYMYGEKIADVAYRDVQFGSAPADYPLTGFTLPGNPQLPPPAAAQGDGPQRDEPEVTAQDVFDETLFNLARRYGGFSRVDAAALRREYQPQLLQVCAAQPVCAPARAYPLLTDLVDSLRDQHSSFEPANEVQRGSPGVAVYFGFDVTGAQGRAAVRTVVPGTPAARAGMRVGDVIEEINGTPVTAFTFDERLPDGAADFRVSRQGTRVNLKLTPVTDEPAPAWYVRRPDNVAVIRIDSFRQDGTGQAVHDAVRKAMRDDVKGIILDLRWNPGGRLTEFLLSAGAFTQPNTLFLKQPTGRRSFVYENGTVKQDSFEVESVKNPVRFTGKVAVLVNGGSASGAEFLAREMEARPNTIVLGSPTVGVGNTAVRTVPLSDGSELHVTSSVVQDAQGLPLAPEVQPKIPLRLDPETLVSLGRDNMLETAASMLK